MSQLAERYSDALFEATDAKGNREECLQVLTELKKSLLENRSILELLSTPLVSDEEKVQILTTAIAPVSNNEITTFFKLLTKNDRLAHLPDVITAFQDRSSKELGLVSGSVKSSHELSDSEKSEVKKLIEKELQTSVELEFNTDPTMIGGIEAKVGSYVFEDSIKSHMQKLNDFITRRV